MRTNQRASRAFKQNIISCDRLVLGESAEVAYVGAKERSILMRLSALGVVPGVELRLLQRWPCFVFQCEETEIAVEENIAREIFVSRQE